MWLISYFVTNTDRYYDEVFSGPGGLFIHPRIAGFNRDQFVALIEKHNMGDPLFWGHEEGDLASDFDQFNFLDYFQSSNHLTKLDQFVSYKGIQSVDSFTQRFYAGGFFFEFFKFLEDYDRAVSETSARRTVRLKFPWLLAVEPIFVILSSISRKSLNWLHGFFLSVFSFVRDNIIRGFLGVCAGYVKQWFSGERHFLDHAAIGLGITGLINSTRHVSKGGLKGHLISLLILVSGLVGLSEIINKSTFFASLQSGVVSQSDEDDNEAFNFINHVFVHLSKLCDIPKPLGRTFKTLIQPVSNGTKNRIRDLVAISKMVLVVAGPTLFDDVEKWLFGSYNVLLKELVNLAHGDDWTNYMSNSISRSRFKENLELCHVYFNASCWDVGGKSISNIVSKHRSTVKQLRNDFNKLPPISQKMRFETIGLFFSGPSGIAKTGALTPAIGHIVDLEIGTSGSSSPYPTKEDWGDAASATHLVWDDCQATYITLEPTEASRIASGLMNLLSTADYKPDIDRLEKKGTQVQATTLCMTSNRAFNKVAFVCNEAIDSRINEYVVVPNAILIGASPEDIDTASWSDTEYEPPLNDPMLTFMFNFLKTHFKDHHHYLMNGFVDIFRSGERSRSNDPMSYNSSEEKYSFSHGLPPRGKKYFKRENESIFYTADFTKERGEFMMEFAKSIKDFREIVEVKGYDPLKVNALIGMVQICSYSWVKVGVEQTALSNGYSIAVDVVAKYTDRKKRYEQDVANDPTGEIYTFDTDVSEFELDLPSLAKKGTKHITRPVACGIFFVISCACLYYYMRPRDPCPSEQSFTGGNGNGRMYPKYIYHQGQVHSSDSAQSILKNVVHISTDNRTLAKGLITQQCVQRGVDGHILVLTAHSWELVKQCSNSRLYVSRASDLSSRFSLNIGGQSWMIVMNMEEDADLVYLFVCKNAVRLKFKDLSSKIFPKNTDMGNVELTYHDKLDDVSYVQGIAVPSASHHTGDICIRSTNGAENMYDRNKLFCVELPISTEGGMCGTAAVSAESHLYPGRVIGIHIGGYGHRAYFAKIEVIATAEVTPVSQGEHYSDDFNLDSFLKGDSHFPVQMQPSSFVLGHLHHFMRPKPIHDVPVDKRLVLEDVFPYLPQVISDEVSDSPLKYPSGHGFIYSPYVEMGQRIVLSRVNSFAIDVIAGASAYDDLVITHKLNGCKQFILTYEESIFGSRLPNSRLKTLDKLDHGTSPGPSLLLKYDRCRRSNFLLNRNEKGEIFPGEKAHNFIHDHVNTVEKQLMDGSYTYSVVANWKNELLPYGKSPRAFYVGDLADLIVVRRLFGSALDHVLNNRIANGSAIGANCFGVDWSFIADRLADGLCTDLDISKMEYRAYNDAISGYMVTFFEDFYDGSEDEYHCTPFECKKPNQFSGSARVMRRNFLESIVKPFLHYRGKIYQGMDFNPSGHPLTALLNTLVLQFHYRHAYYSLLQREGYSNVDFPFHAHVADICMGDDCIMSVRESVSSWFTPEAVGDFMKGLDITITAASKKEALAFKDLKDCTFLRRRFHRDGGILKARLCMDTLLNLMVWGVKKPAKDRKAAVVDAILIEAQLWGRPIFQWFLKCIKYSLSYTKETSIPVHNYEWYSNRAAGNDRK